MNTDDSQPLLLKIADRKKFEDMITYVYAGGDSGSVHKPISVYTEKNTNGCLVAGRYVGVSETHLKYRPLNEEEQELVLEELGPAKIVRFLSDKASEP
jgi:hypothetical protein